MQYFNMPRVATSFHSYEFSLDIREKIGPGQKESPAGAVTSLALLSASSIYFLVSPNGAGSNDVAFPFSLFLPFAFPLLFPLLP